MSIIATSTVDVEKIPDRNWRAHLGLKFSGREDKTIISHRQHYGPLVIQKPFYPEPDVCHVYLLHPPGGVVGGDQLILDVEVNRSGHALITTPAAGKFYRSAGSQAQLKQTLVVKEKSTLEWLPQETILFSGCEVKLQTIVQLEQDASFIGWEILCLGRPAGNELFTAGSARQSFEIWRNKKPLLLDRARLAGNDDVLFAQWGMQKYTVTGTMMAVNVTRQMLNHVRENMPEMKQGLISVTLINDVLVCRALSHQAEYIRFAFIDVWKSLRINLLGRDSCEPRIWST
jgi:urease accessory protein